MDTITEKFLNHLSDRGSSNLTVKNYKADLKKFESWIINFLKSKGISTISLTECVPLLSFEYFEEYRKFLISINLSVSSLNRNLSSLRSFINFLKSESYYNPTSQATLSNISRKDSDSDEKRLLREYENYLRSSKMTQNTLKNYLNDIRQLLNWSAKLNNN